MKHAAYGMLLFTVGFGLACCGNSDGSSIRFCESFTDLHDPIGEDVSFSTGTLSCLLETDKPIGHSIVRVRVFRTTDVTLTPYGREAVFSINPNSTSLRFDDALSIADTGTYSVSIQTRTGRPLAEGNVRIIAPM